VTNADLVSKCEELKHRLATDEYKHLIDVILGGIGRFIQKISRNPTPVPFWYSAIILALSILATSFLTSILLNEFYQIRLDRLPSEITLVTLTLVGTIILKIHLDATFDIWRNKLIDAVETSQDLADIQRWFATVCNVRKQLFLSLPLGLLFGIYAIVFVSIVRGGFFGVGPTILDIVVSIQVFLGLYYVFLFANLSIRLRRYHFRLFTIDPRRSETIQQLSGLLFNYVYGIAFFVATITLVLSIFAVMTLFNIVLLFILGWAPIIIAFILNQYSLSRIIIRSKWQMLNKVQKRIEALHSEQDIVEKDVIEATTRLLDFQDRIWASRNSVLDINSVLGFINSLLLPLFTFLLGNLDTIVGFLFK